MDNQIFVYMDFSYLLYCKLKLRNERTHLLIYFKWVTNAKIQRIARRDKKDFLNEQCKEIEVNNIMGETKNFFKKIGEVKGTFHARMGKIKDRNNKDLT